MSITFNEFQKQVDERVNRHPAGYFSNEIILAKMEEEKKEINEALLAYEQAPTEENLKAFKIEIGDELFALICLANKNNVSIEECFTLMMEKNKNRESNQYKKEDK
ncbi:MAG: nucleotide pyrophosphohydrolase [candidate division SR1 bacterium]|nr:nucleotide pyrophosphohydrolase [candidate division SR1 bacterium]